MRQPGNFYFKQNPLALRGIPLGRQFHAIDHAGCIGPTKGGPIRRVQIGDGHCNEKNQVAMHGVLVAEPEDSVILLRKREKFLKTQKPLA